MAAPASYRVAPRKRFEAVGLPPDTAGVMVLPPLVYGAGFVLGLVLQSGLPRTILPPDLAAPIGFAVLLCGALLAMWSRRTMEAAGTATDPRLPATSLVVTGPFRFSRNPMYLGRTLLYLGLALLANALWVLAALVPVLAIIRYGVIEREERYLDRRFGDAYRQYRTLVRRWI